MKTKRLVIDALCAALYVLLSSFASVSLLNLKLGQLLGPYGLSVTTPLWMLPAAVRGLLVGLWARRRGGRYGRGQLAAVLVGTALAVTALNTGVMWVDSRVFAYPFAATLPSVALRVAAGLVTSGLYTLLLPPIVRALRRGGLTEREDA